MNNQRKLVESREALPNLTEEKSPWKENIILFCTDQNKIQQKLRDQYIGRSIRDLKSVYGDYVRIIRPGLLYNDIYIYYQISVTLDKDNDAIKTLSLG